MLSFYKILEKDKTLYFYKILSNVEPFEAFYLKIDKKKNELSFYLTDVFDSPVKRLLLNSNDPIGLVEGINWRHYKGAVCKSLAMIKEDVFPEKTSYVTH